MVHKGPKKFKHDLRIFREYLGVHVINVNFRNPIQVLSGQKLFLLRKGFLEGPNITYRVIEGAYC